MQSHLHIIEFTQAMLQVQNIPSRHFFEIKKLFNGWYYEQVLIANRIARMINSDTINLENISIFRLIYTLLFNGRRKLSDRFFAFIGIMFSRLTSKI